MNKRKKYPKDLKRHLLEEAGNKCANPGCSNHLTELHHIKEWATHRSHDRSHMIAVCPSCHDAITRGTLRIDDQTLYNWKRIIRNTPKNYHIYTEPNSPSKILLGSLAIQTPEEVIIFELSNKNILKFQVINNEILLVDSTIKSLKGEILFEMRKNHIKSRTSDNLEVRQRPGKFQLIANKALSLVPTWVISKHLLHDQEYLSSQEYALVDIEVTEPGIIKVNGVWLDQEEAIVVSQIGISFITKTRQEPITLRGEGKDSILYYVGPINKNLFSFREGTFSNLGR